MSKPLRVSPGWSDVRRWSSKDSQLVIDAEHDGTGHVTLTATLRNDASSPTAWTAQVAVTLEGGEQLSQLATDVRELLGR